jgi:hypothetical protein
MILLFFLRVNSRDVPINEQKNNKRADALSEDAGKKMYKVELKIAKHLKNKNTIGYLIRRFAVRKFYSTSASFSSLSYLTLYFRKTALLWERL